MLFMVIERFKDRDRSRFTGDSANTDACSPKG